MVVQVHTAEEHFFNQLKKAHEDTNDARREHEKAVVARKSREGVTTGLGMLTAGNAAVGAVGIVSPPMAVIQSVLGYCSTIFSRIKEGTPILDVMEQRRVREDTAKEEKISQDALNCVVDLYLSVSKAALIIGDMKSCTTRASAVIDQKRGLKKLAQSVPEDGINFRDLYHKLEMLLECARQILIENGLRPISKNPDELVSNTRLYHDTDGHGPRLQNVMEFDDSDESKPLPSQLDNSSNLNRLN